MQYLLTLGFHVTAVVFCRIVVFLCLPRLDSTKIDWFRVVVYMICTPRKSIPSSFTGFHCAVLIVTWFSCNASSGFLSMRTRLLITAFSLVLSTEFGGQQRPIVGLGFGPEQALPRQQEPGRHHLPGHPQVGREFHRTRLVLR